LISNKIYVIIIIDKKLRRRKNMKKLIGNTGVEMDKGKERIKISSFISEDNLSNFSTIILKGKIKNTEKIKELAETVDKLNVPVNFWDFRKNYKNIFIEIYKYIENVEKIYIEINKGKEDINDVFTAIFHETVKNFGNVNTTIKNGLNYLKAKESKIILSKEDNEQEEYFWINIEKMTAECKNNTCESDEQFLKIMGKNCKSYCMLLKNFKIINKENSEKIEKTLKLIK
jgi:hypothetical protein